MPPKEFLPHVVKFCDTYISEKKAAAEKIGSKIQALVRAGVSNTDTALKSLDRQLLGIEQDIAKLLDAKAKLLRSKTNG